MILIIFYNRKNILDDRLSLLYFLNNHTIPLNFARRPCNEL
jgi:hypothetical protein